MGVRQLVLAIGLGAGNYIFQVMADVNWGTAAERTFFQCFALVMAWIILPVDKSASSGLHFPRS